MVLFRYKIRLLYEGRDIIANNDYSESETHTN